VHRQGAGPIIISAEVKFRKEVKNREVCVIQTQCSDYRRMIFKIDQKMINAKGDLACMANYTCALFDLKARKIIQPTDAFLRAIGLWAGETNPRSEAPHGTHVSHDSVSQT
jgi:acyl-CoA thioesterase FadM